MILLRPNALKHALVAGALLLGVSCGGSDSTGPGDGGGTPPPPSVGSVTFTSSPGEQVVGSTIPLEVRVTSTTGQAMSGQAVTFSTGAGSVNPSSASTGASGTVTVSWTLGTTAGPQTLTASAGSQSATATVTTRPGPPATIEKARGDGQTGEVGQALPQAIVASVKDAFGNPLPGQAVTVAVDGGGGSVSETAITTQADGGASTVWTLGSIPGTNTLTMTHAVGSVSFTATGQAGQPSIMVAVAGDKQSAQVGTAVAVAPRVRVTDSQGNPIGGVAVTFTVDTGGGSVTGESSSTGSDGLATVGSWTLGAEPGTNTLSASTPGRGLGNVIFTATGTPAGSAFSIDLRYIGSMSPSIQAAFERAKARWEQVIVGDLPNSTLNSAAGECLDNQPAVNETIDDVLIFAEVAAIDGVGNTLGQAGPCYIRNSGGTALMGGMTFDEADLAEMETSGTLDDVILHEMGHVLGIGTLWENRGLLVGKGGADPYFIGTQGILAYVGMGGVLSPNPGVPVEDTGGEGTRDGHWRESVFANELMTGYVSAPGNPLSILTVKSLADNNYTVDDAAADPYNLPSPASPVAGEAVLRRGPAWERLLRPIAAVDPDGRMRPIR